MDTETFLTKSYTQIRSVAAVPAGTQARTLPTSSALSLARSSLPSLSPSPSPSPSPSSSSSPSNLPPLAPLGPQATIQHLLTAVAPALPGHNRSGRYFGFVTGSSLPVAEAADNLASALDTSVQVHLPEQSIATEVEDVALRLLLRLLGLESETSEEKGEGLGWEGRTFTTGATASNILGLACGREEVVRRRLPAASEATVGELGILGACAEAGIREIRVLTSMGHSSLSKAASVVGLGRRAVKELPYSEAEPWRLDLDAVERELKRTEEGIASIVAISAGEVNTGRFATTGLEDMRRLRELADKYQAWIHVDGAFGIFARALPDTDEFAKLREATAGLELADSITVDGHKLLNVPYDTGIFFTRQSATLHAVFQNPNAAYLTPSGSGPAIPSPLNIGIENSRRFRALPVYAVLLSEGAAGIAEMLARMVRLARGVALALISDPDLKDDYELLPADDAVESTHVIVLFRARDVGLNGVLVRKIQDSGEWYVSGTKWKGEPACRIAVSSWRVNVEEDLEFVKSRLAGIAKEWKEGGR
ncbi:PLP-dependent transferase [Annulohypoxylon truncatum]|uniref:PLP-dependent transferase n=1 Tax=Annulohypoxylon truncatum TaxID=327061 RepID=UPI002007A40A|nr:PLP-dependent transferase [Annulohypoxylon truncatum]KAI1211562.1 PLP-dependent transferase [Annulohypoxylon truncatum]